MNTPTIRDPEKYRLALNAADEARRKLLARLNTKLPRREEQLSRQRNRSLQDVWHSATAAARMRYEPKRVSRNFYLQGLDELL